MCRDWLIGMQPAFPAFGEGSDVSGGVEVAMQREITGLAFEGSSVPVSFADVATTIAGLGSVVAIDQNHFLACEGSLVGDFVEEVSRAPTSKKLDVLGVLAPALSHFHSGWIQLFQSNCVAIAFNYSFADAVVGVSDKPSFSSRQFFEMSFGGTSACSLKLLFCEPVFSLDFTKMLAVEKYSVGNDCWKISSPINSNNSCGLAGSGNFNLDDYIEINYSVLGSECSSGNLCVNQTWQKIVWDGEFVFSPSFDCADVSLSSFNKHIEEVVVEPDTTTCLLYWQDRLIVFKGSLQHVACLVADRCDCAAIECWKLFSHGVIGGVVESQFVVILAFEPRRDTVVAGFIGEANRIQQFPVGICDSKLCCNLHNLPLGRNKYIYLSPKGEYDASKNAPCNFQPELSFSVLPEISPACFGREGCRSGGGTDEAGLSGTGLDSSLPFNSTRPRSYLHNGETLFFPDVYREGVEGEKCYSRDEGEAVCETVLESELLCWNGWNRERGNNQEIHRGTNPCFPTTLKNAVSPHGVILWQGRTTAVQREKGRARW